MPHLPLNIDARGMIALVAGGGNVAGQKIISLLAAGVTVRLVAPELTPEITRLVAESAVELKSGYYEPCDLNGAFLAVAATNDPETNHRIATDARRRGMLVVVTDDPKSGNCSFPALLRRGELEVTVSTNGSCPGFAAVVRDMLATVISEEYGSILATLVIEREKLLTEESHSTYNREILRSRARELINKFAEHKERVP